MHKPYNCGFSRYIEVYQNGSSIGKVQEVFAPFSRKFVEILDSNSETLYNITGPSCPGTCLSLGDNQFDVTNVKISQCGNYKIFCHSDFSWNEFSHFIEG